MTNKVKSNLSLPTHNTFHSLLLGDGGTQSHPSSAVSTPLTKNTSMSKTPPIYRHIVESCAATKKGNEHNLL